MARSYFLYIHLDDYLAQWFIYEQGGKYPVELTRGSIECNILEQFLISQPKNAAVSTEADNRNAVKNSPVIEYETYTFNKDLIPNPKELIDKFIKTF